MAKKKAKPKKKPKKTRVKKAKKNIARKSFAKKRAAKKRVAKKGFAKKRLGKKAKADDRPMFEEITYNCPGCGRPMRVVKVSGYDVTGMLCQRCSHGEITSEQGSGG